MKKLLIFIFIFFVLTQVVLANADTKLEQVNRLEEANKKQEPPANKKTAKQFKYTTNYQYDDENYEYGRVKNYVQDNIDYSKSGKYIRFN